MSSSGLEHSAGAASVRPRGRSTGSAANLWVQALAICRKDLLVELRNRAAVNAILLFSVTTLVVVGLAVGPSSVPEGLKAALLWVVIFFAAFSGLAHVFLHEEETGTVLALRLSAQPSAVFVGKLLFNLLLLAAILLIVAPAFLLMLRVEVARPVAFLAVLAEGGFSLAVAATIVAAIIAKARGKGALYGALGFPVLLPLLILALYGTKEAASALAGAELAQALAGLLAFAVMMVTAAAVLFPFVWED